MHEPEENDNLKSRFMTWLSEPNSGAFEGKARGYYTTVIRVPKTDEIDYLYCQHHYGVTSIMRGDKFEYAGIFCKRDGQVYDRQHELREFIAGDGRDKEVLREELKRTVRESVTVAINNDRHNLRITDLTTKSEIDDLTNYQKYDAGRCAREAYLSGEYADGASYAFTFLCHYDPECWTEDSLLAYILAPARYAAAEAAAYLDSHQEDMLSDFLRADIVAAEYAAMLANPMNPVHSVMRIMQALCASSAKTVNVTISKSDTTMTFKAEAAPFRRDCTNTYSTWDIAAADRREFERRFGRGASYGPEDILRIEYARAVLYQAGERADTVKN